MLLFPEFFLQYSRIYLYILFFIVKYYNGNIYFLYLFCFIFYLVLVRIIINNNYYYLAISCTVK